MVRPRKVTGTFSYRGIETIEGYTKETQDDTSAPAQGGDDTSAPAQDEDDATNEEAYNEADLKKKRQAELLEIAAGLGIEATTQNSKAEIISMILEKTLG